VVIQPVVGQVHTEEATVVEVEDMVEAMVDMVVADNTKFVLKSSGRQVVSRVRELKMLTN